MDQQLHEDNSYVDADVHAFYKLPADGEQVLYAGCKSSVGRRIN